MRSDLFDVTVILDRSGSMQSCRTDAEGGLNAFIEEQKKQIGETLFSLVQFDDKYEVVYAGVPVCDVPKFTLVPRGWTALYDAIGKTINDIGARLDKMPEPDRPGLVVVAILTDGQENTSKEFDAAQIKAMIERQKSAYNWQFTYLGANQDAFAASDRIGIARGATANYSDQKTSGAFAGMAKNVGRMKLQSAGGQSIHNSYTAEERADMGGDPPVDPADATK